MKMEYIITPRRTDRSFALTAIAAVVAGSFAVNFAYAQAPEAESEGEAPAEEAPSAPVAEQGAAVSPEATPDDGIETIFVTGSRIKQRIKREEGPAPVAVITKEQIEKQGYTSAVEVIGSLSQNAGGSFNAGQSFSFARGTQSVDLRGFGAGRTLVLLDGRRLPVFPQGLGGTDAFVDLSTIPTSMIERVEVLLDGASAIYGSDAISGVVNIITRKDITGTMLSARVFDTEDGGGGSRRFQLAQGLIEGDTSIQIIGEYTDQDVLRFTDRSFSESDFGNGGNASGFGSSFANEDGVPFLADPSCGQPDGTLAGGGVLTSPTTCRFDRAKYRQFISPQQKGSVYLRLDRKFGDVKSFARFGYYRSKLTFELEPNAYSGGESFAFTDQRIYGSEFFDPIFGPGYVPAGAPNNPTNGTADEQGGYFFRRLVEFGPRGGEMVTQSYNGLFGLEGTIGDYSWDIGLSHNEVRADITTPTILSSVLDYEVSVNGLDLFQRIPDEIVRRASHLQSEKAVSRTSGVDATFTGPVGPLTLPGGPVQFALHGDYQEQEYSDVFDPISTAGDVFDGGSGGGGDRKYTGVGLEFVLPILQNLEANIAGRVDSYSDASETGSAFSPNVRVSYKPIEQLLLRASWGESFRAPDLQRLFGATSNGFETVIDTPRCLEAGGTPGTAIDPSNDNDICLPIQSVPSATGSNPKLKEETGENFSAGLVVEPVRDLAFKFDYYRIKVSNLVSNLDAQQLLDLCGTSGQFCDQIRRDPVTGLLGTPSAGGSNAALISANALNLASQEIKGYDVSLGYDFYVDGFGGFSTELGWSHVDSLKVRSQPGAEEVEQIGFGQTILIPEDRYTWTNDWNFERYGVTLRVDRVGKYPGSNALTEPAKSNQYVDPYTTVNLQARVDFGKVGLIRLGIDNLFDEDFPLDPTFVDAGGPNVQNQFLGEATSFYASPLGRAGYVQYEIKF